MRDNPISSTIPFDQDGVHHGFLKLPFSRDDSAWGSVMIPICVIKNGDGPTALFTGGNHGDEYEGPIALQNLALELGAESGVGLDQNKITGRVIIIPGFNYPAFQSGTRTSPIDKGNMNRSFPGRPDGTVTQKIADYFQRTLVPMADIVLDFHSGGKTLDFIPFAAVHILDDKKQQAQCVAAMQRCRHLMHPTPSCCWKLIMSGCMTQLLKTLAKPSSPQSLAAAEQLLQDL